MNGERRKKVGTWKWGYAFVVAGDEGKRKRKTRPSVLIFLFFKKQQQPNLTPNPNLRGCVFFKECHMWSHSVFIYLFNQ